MAQTATTTRRVYPCVLDLTPEATASAAEFSCWLTPNLLVTSCNTHVCTYTLLQERTLQLRSTHVLQGSVIGLFSIPCSASITTPLLLIAIAPARFSLIALQDTTPQLLPSVSIADIVAADSSSSSSAEEDMQVAVHGNIIACSIGPRLTILSVDPHACQVERGTTWMSPGGRRILDVSVRTASGGLEGALVLVLHTTTTSVAVTALTVSLVHQRTAVVWTTPAAPDAQQVQVHQQRGGGGSSSSLVVVVGVNGFQWLDTSTGAVCAAPLPVNGWSTSTTVAASSTPPLLRLAIALDAARFVWLRDDTALVVLRKGHVYWLVRSKESEDDDDGDWMLLPTGHSLELCGEVASLSVRPSQTTTIGGETKEESQQFTLLCGSRLGDSFLLQLEIAPTNIPAELMEAKRKARPRTIIQFGNEENNEHDWVHAQDQELYNLVSDDDDDDNDADINGSKRRKTGTWYTLRSMQAIDRIVGLGPLGDMCEGTASTRLLIPTGYGRSGGVALVTRPGQDERCIVSEHDVLQVETMSHTAKDMVCLGMANGKGVQVLVRNTNDSATEWVQAKDMVDQQQQKLPPEGTSLFSSVADIFQSKLLLSSVLQETGQMVLVVRPPQEQRVCLVVLAVGEQQSIDIVLHATLQRDDETAELVQLTEIVESTTAAADDDANVVFSFGCMWSHGGASYVVVDLATGQMRESSIPPLHEPMQVDDDDDDDDENKGEEEDEEAKAIRDFYRNTAKATAIDVFRAPQHLFDPSSLRNADSKHKDCPSDANADKMSGDADDAMYDDYDRELYGIPKPAGSASGVVPQLFPAMQEVLDEAKPSLYVAVVRQSGDLEVYEVLIGQEHVLRWSAKGIASGLSCIRQQSKEPRQPRLTCVSVAEIKFFRCGSSATSTGNEAVFQPKFCVAMRTSDGDVALYNYAVGLEETGPFFHRHVLHCVTRTSEEQGRHHKKLTRKKIVSATATEDSFQCNMLRRFTGISDNDGLFVLTARPFWILCTKGLPVAVPHRLRHGAPAGGTDTPMRGMCTLHGGDDDNDSSFFTIHERVGRVGSQRLTLFRGIFPPESKSTVIPGGGFLVEKVHMGVTVRKVVYLPPESSSSTSATEDKPTPQLYALLVSQEEETDQSKLNHDGLTDEERAQVQAEKEAARIKKQVEADLGGFDIESEWVEEIERMDRLEVNTEIGGAPPIHQSIYSLWIVDSTNDWGVVDSFQLEEYEHGIDLALMTLSIFKDATGKEAPPATAEDEELEKQQFIVLGTGTVNRDGEDVATKGRALLFSLKRPDTTSSSGIAEQQPVADLTLTYEKNIFHGPVTTVSCLSSEGKNRLVIGAGSDVNIEQWGSSEKLTQVGFYRATMHILDIQHFKNFMILADAYDSFYFLVWRESDKSLTLLAKDYDPIVVYAAGVMSRGSSLTFVCHDDRENLQFFQYAPGEAAARGGNKLVCRADFHLGETTTALSTFYCPSSLLVHSATPNSTSAALTQQDPLFGRQDDDQRIGIYFGTTGGGLGAIVAMNEPMYWRLLALQSVMANALESDAALSPRAWRQYVRSTRRHGCRNNDRKRGVIDGDLVRKFAELSVPEQEDLASSIGSTAKLIADNLVEIQCASSIL